MTSDDNEKDTPRVPVPLPPAVERALAEARASAASADGSRQPVPGTKSARWLAAIPLTAGVLAIALMMPRAVPPEDIPLPQIDGRALSAVRKDDGERAATARTTRLSSDVLAVGSALRALNKALVRNAAPEEIGAARTTIEHAFANVAGGRAEAADALRTLRAVQVEAFLAEVDRFEQTGSPTEELEELGGAFVDRMAAAGWLRNGKILLDEAARRAAYKLVWNAQVGADRVPELALVIDEERALYTFYLTHPHAPEAQRLAYENMRRNAGAEDGCTRAIRMENEDIEQWRLEKIRRLGELDPSYPLGFAVGVAQYRAGRYDLAIESFRTWLAAHPDGPLALRARNHLKAALLAFGT